ncbi:MAG: hypothetical protein OHK0046_15120 [Anaerolineae bacterium]
MFFLIGVVLAQESLPTCSAAMVNFYTSASELCLAGPDGHICNGGNPPLAEPQGPVSNSLASAGALVPVDAVQMVNTTAFAADGSSGGVAWLRVAETGTRGVLMGDVMVRDATPEGVGFPKWTAMEVETRNSAPTCQTAPSSAFVLQTSTAGQAVRVVVNGVSLDLNGTVMIQTEGDETLFMTLEGELRVIANGQTQGMVAGQQARAAHAPSDYSTAVGPPGMPEPFDNARVQNFPIALLDRAIRLPQPGFVRTEGAVNMRTEPNTNAPIILQVPAGTIMTILGRNTPGDWYHVRLPSGETGWMFAELLVRSHGAISAVYEATPVPPQRFGTLGTAARVISPTGVTLRSAPDVGFSALSSLQPDTQVELLARSPYSPWVKINTGDGTVGWVALISLDTRAIIESLPVDYNVPPPPEPTPIPGLWGGAFPDPSCYPNCG